MYAVWKWYDFATSGDRTAVIRGFWVISIVIDSDRGHSYEHLKKKSIYDENWTRECLCMRWIFELPEIAKNEILQFLGPTCVS